MLAVLQALDNFLGRFLPAELSEAFLDVLNFKRTGLESVLADDVFHSVKYSSGLCLQPFIKDRNIACWQCEMNHRAVAGNNLQLYFLAVSGNLFDIGDVPIDSFSKRQ